MPVTGQPIPIPTAGPVVGSLIPTPAGSADLVDPLSLASALGPIKLSVAELAELPRLARAASGLLRRWCNRHFNRRILDRLYTLDPWTALILDELPVNAILRLATGPTQVLAVGNTATGTVARATARLATTGDVAGGLVPTGLTLTAWIAGVPQVQAVSFDAPLTPTVAGLAAAVNALGGGWTATADGSFAGLPVGDFRPPQGAYPCLGSQQAGFVMHVEDVAFTLDERTGIVELDDGTATDPWNSPRWGPALSTSLGDTTLRGGDLAVRCVADVGFDVIPGPVEQACIEAVKGMVERLRTDSTLRSEADGTYRWDARDVVEALPAAILQQLAGYRRLVA